MPDETTVAALAEALNEHLTERASEAGCRLACGYDGDDMAAHLARALLASPALADLLRAERAEAWDEGYGTGYDDCIFDDRGFSTDPHAGEYPHANPYRAEREATR